MLRPRRVSQICIKYIQRVEDKIARFKNEVKNRNLSFDKVCFVGNDVNDIECLKQAGIGIAVADSHPKVLKVADLILTKKGGEGAVRAVCDLILE